jgi:hypothetical protein
MRQGFFCQHLQTAVIINPAIIGQKTAVPMTGVFTHTHIGYYQQFGSRILDNFYRLLHRPIGIKC